MFARSALLLQCRSAGFFASSKSALLSTNRCFHKLQQFSSNGSAVKRALLCNAKRPCYCLRETVQCRQFCQRRNESSGVPQAGIRLIWSKLFGKYLLATNILSSGILMVFGDIVAQEIEIRRSDAVKDLGTRYDLTRVARMFIVGALLGPIHHYVYAWMDRILPVPNFRSAMWKILMDQLFMSPVCILMFFYSACFMEQKSIRETHCELGEKFLYIYLMDWLMWPGVQYINFRYLHFMYRVMFVNVCTALYNIFLSYMKHDF